MSIPNVRPLEISRQIAQLDAIEKNKIVEALSSERLEFRQQWNNSLVINQLPNELLIQIFTMLICLDSAFYSGSWTQEVDPRFWRLIGVCRHWRDVITVTPAFWCSVNLAKNINWIQLCLARSLTTPIDVSLKVPSMCHPDPIKLVYPVVHRIRSLYFQVDVGLLNPNPEVFTTLSFLFGDGMFILEKLNLVVTCFMGGPYHPPVDMMLNAQRFPHLNSLSLTGTVAPQDASLYMQLRTLSLKNCSHNLSFDRFLDVLASCTHLKHLHLENTLNRLPGNWMQRDLTPRRPLISFPHLDTFRVSRHGAVCTSIFLTYFHIRSSVHLYISAEIEDYDGPFGACSMVPMLPPSHAINLEPLAMASDVRMYTGAGLPSDPVIVVGGFWAHTADNTFTPAASLSMNPNSGDLGYHVAAQSRWGSVGDVAELLGRSPLTSLSVHGILSETASTWAGVFWAFPLLERLSVNAVRGRAELDPIENIFLGLHEASLSAVDPNTPVCPNLAHVSVCSVETRAAYEAIRTCVRYRAERGVFMEHLDLQLLYGTRDMDELPDSYLKDIQDCTRPREKVA